MVVIRTLNVSDISLHYCQRHGQFQDTYVKNPLAYANALQTILPVSRLDKITFNAFAINMHQHRSLPSVCCWDFICHCLLFLACAVFAL